MIHIIGTAHGKTQYWSDLISKGESLDTCPVIVERFEFVLAGRCHFAQRHDNCRGEQQAAR